MFAGWRLSARGEEPSTNRDGAKGGECSALEADERVNKILAAQRDFHHLPGMAGAIFKGESLAVIGAVGVRKLGSDEAMRVGDRVHLGSCTKAMTATVIGILVDEGKLKWSSTIGEVFPKEAGALHEDYQKASLHQLLSHRAGLPANTAWGLLGKKRTTTDQRRVLLSAVLKDAPKSKPGTKFEYSNVGYALAGLMAEQVTGMAWEVLMKERLFEPLGMTSAGFGAPGEGGKIQEPWGHHEVGGRVEASQGDNAPALGPAGTVHASLPDWAKFGMLHNQGERGKARLLKAGTFRALHTPDAGESYVGGWMVVKRPWAGGTALTHSGSNTMWYATIWLAPGRDFGTLVATNQGGEGASKACAKASEGLILLARHLKAAGRGMPAAR